MVLVDDQERMDDQLGSAKNRGCLEFETTVGGPIF